MSGPPKMTPEEKAERNARLAQMQKEHFQKGQILNYKNAAADVWGSEIRQYAVPLSTDGDPVLEAKREGLRAEHERLSAAEARSGKDKGVVEAVSSFAIGGSFLATVLSHWEAWPVLVAAGVAAVAKIGYDEYQSGRRSVRQNDIAHELVGLDERLQYADEAHRKVRNRLGALKTQFAAQKAGAVQEPGRAPEARSEGGKLGHKQKNQKNLQGIRRQGPAF